jgi:hypothetical protein
MGGVLSKESLRNPHKIVQGCPLGNPELRVAVVEELACTGEYLRVDGACVMLTGPASKMDVFTEDGLVVVLSVLAYEQITVDVVDDRYQIVTSPQQVTIAALGSTELVFVVRRMLHTISWGPWFDKSANPWAKFAKHLREQPGTDCLVNGHDVGDISTWSVQLCGEQRRPERVFSGISNFHGNVGCSVCKRAFLTLREWREIYKQANDVDMTFDMFMCQRSAFIRGACHFVPNATVEENQLAMKSWLENNLTSHCTSFMSRLEFFSTKFMEDVPFLCPNMCCLGRDARPHNYGEAYICMMPSAMATELEEEDGEEEEDEEDLDLTRYTTRVHAIEALMCFEPGWTPNALLVLQSCNAAFEPSLARAFQRLGTQFVLGYIKPVWNVTSLMFVVLLYDEWKKLRYACNAVPEAFQRVVLNPKALNLVRATMPVLFLPNGSCRCFDLPAFLNNEVRQLLTYSPTQRPFWVFDPNI